MPYKVGFDPKPFPNASTGFYKEMHSDISPMNETQRTLPQIAVALQCDEYIRCGVLSDPVLKASRLCSASGFQVFGAS